MIKVNAPKLLQHLNKWNGASCPLCGGKNWNAHDSIFELREFNKGGLVIGGSPVLPVVPITCMNCGNTILVNAFVAGLMEEQESKK